MCCFHRRLHCGLITSLAILLVSTFVVFFVEPVETAAQERPNLIVIQLDDASAELLDDAHLKAYFPQMLRLRESGLRFSNAHVSSIDEEPNRCGFLRGQTPWALGIHADALTGSQSSGFEIYRKHGYVENDLSTRMQDAGYRTILVGKYFQDAYDGLVPSGWDDLSISYGNSYYETVRLKVRDGERQSHGRLDNGEYRTAFEGHDILDSLRHHFNSNNSAPDESSSDSESDSTDGDQVEPFFLMWTPVAPRLRMDSSDNYDAMIDVRNHGDRWTDVKPPWLTRGGPIDHATSHPSLLALSQADILHPSSIEPSYRARLLALKSVDEVVGSMMRLLGRLNVDQQTIVVITSDGGTDLGQRGIASNALPYDSCTRVPLIFSGQGIAQGSQTSQLVVTTDVMPTLLELAQARVPDYVDGRSLVRWLSEPGYIDSDSSRPAIVIQGWRRLTDSQQTIETPYFSILRTHDTAYIEWADGIREYYELAADPTQRTNLIDTLSDDRVAELHEQMMMSFAADAKPFVAVSNPEPNAIIGNSRLRLLGIAGASGQVNHVQLTIRDESSGNYWNGLEWNAGEAVVAAELEQHGSQTAWSYTLEPIGLPDAETPLSVAIVVEDAQGRRQSLSERLALQVDGVLPSTEVLAPLAESPAANPVRIAGQSHDNHAISKVSLSIRSRATGEYWNGSAFQAERTRVDIDVDQDGAWNYELRVPAGPYILIARTRDEAGNVDSEPIRRQFIVE